jgi:hypothetical protein
MKGIIAAGLALAVTAAGCSGDGRRTGPGGEKMNAYYVDAVAGDDANPGTSPEKAWKTVEKANGAVLKAGEHLLFRGGQVFAGKVELTATESGSPGAPVEISSFGKGLATIDGGAGDAVVAEGCHDIRITRLIVKGMGRLEGNKGGRGVLLSRVKDAVVDGVEASGFQKAGIHASESEKVRVTNCHAHDNGFAGIWIWGGKGHYVGDSRAINNPGDPTIMDNHSGNGILLGGCEDSLVEYCESAENGWDQPKGGQGNGPVGIWCHDAKRITIQNCIAHHNKSTSGDGGGFDFDGGTSESVLQYNYSYENKSSAVLLWEYGSRLPLCDNVIRYNISVNDGESGIRFGKSGGQDVARIEIYNNLVINDRVPCVWGQNDGVKDIRIRNNIFIGPRAGEMLKDRGGVRYEGNCWWAPDGRFEAGGIIGFESWASATGQEMSGGQPVGLFANPRLANADSVPRITNPHGLSALRDFMLSADSPCIDRGMDLKGRFGLDPGGRDFFGGPAPRGTAPDIGVHEAR